LSKVRVLTSGVTAFNLVMMALLTKSDVLFLTLRSASL
jgi:hypothetical protein